MLEIIDCPIFDECADCAPIVREDDLEFFCPLAILRWRRALNDLHDIPEVDGVDMINLQNKVGDKVVTCPKNGQLV